MQTPAGLFSRGTVTPCIAASAPCTPTQRKRLVSGSRTLTPAETPSQISMASATRRGMTSPIRHLLRKVLDRLLLAQIVGLGGRTAQQLIRNDDGNRLGGMIGRCHATSAWLWSILHRSA